jgi:acyl-coenzyme A thioesterase PaaI-like protein
VESATVSGNHVKIEFRFPVLYEYCNPAHLLHGAAQGLFYDNCMAYLPMPLRKPGFWEELGFTRNLSVNFLRTVKLGEIVLLEVEVSLPWSAV